MAAPPPQQVSQLAELDSRSAEADTHTVQRHVRSDPGRVAEYARLLQGKIKGDATVQSKEELVPQIIREIKERLLADSLVETPASQYGMVLGTTVKGAALEVSGNRRHYYTRMSECVYLCYKAAHHAGSRCRRRWARGERS